MFKKRKPRFSRDESRQRFEDQSRQILNEVVRVGKQLLLESWEREQGIDYQEKLNNLPKNQQNSLLNKVQKIAVFKTGKISNRFTATLEQKLINLLRADLVGKPLRLSRNNNQWSGSGRFARLGMDYNESFAIDDILCFLGIAEQHIPEDG